MYDRKLLDELVDPDNEDSGKWSDSACRSEETELMLEKAGDDGLIREKGQGGKPLGAEHEANNRQRSNVRSRIGDVFGFQRSSMGGTLLRPIGLTNMTCDLMRYLQPIKRTESAFAAA